MRTSSPCPHQWEHYLAGLAWIIPNPTPARLGAAVDLFFRHERKLRQAAVRVSNGAPRAVFDKAERNFKVEFLGRLGSDLPEKVEINNNPAGPALRYRERIDGMELSFCGSDVFLRPPHA